MPKKKVDYKQKYHDHFGIIDGEAVDEYEFIVKNRIVMANKVHHILFGAHKTDDIENLMALTDDGTTNSNHGKCHDEQLNRYYMKEIHLQFMNNNPY